MVDIHWLFCKRLNWPKESIREFSYKSMNCKLRNFYAYRRIRYRWFVETHPNMKRYHTTFNNTQLAFLKTWKFNIMVKAFQVGKLEWWSGQSCRILTKNAENNKKINSTAWEHILNFVFVRSNMRGMHNGFFQNILYYLPIFYYILY